MAWHEVVVPHFPERITGKTKQWPSFLTVGTVLLANQLGGHLRKVHSQVRIRESEAFQGVHILNFTNVLLIVVDKNKLGYACHSASILLYIETSQLLANALYCYCKECFGEILNLDKYKSTTAQG